MANVNLTIDQITQELLMRLHEKLSFVGTVNKDYDSSFAKSGAKIGDTLRVRKPVQFVASDGATMVLQDAVEEKTTMKIDSRKHIAWQFSTQDLALDIDRFSERYIDSAASALAAKIEEDCIARATKSLNNFVGTAGTIPNTLATYLSARTLMNEALASKSGRNMQISSRMSAEIVEGLKGLFNDQKELGSQYREGAMGRAVGFDWGESEYTHTQTNGDHTFTGTAVNANVATNGTTSITLKTMGNAKTIKKGERFTIAGVYDIHQETKAPRSVLKNFVVTADATSTAGGLATLEVYPPMYFDDTVATAGGRQNMSKAPAADDAITWVGTASESYLQGLAYSKDTFQFATADLEIPSGVDMASRQNFEGISLRVVRDYSITDDVLPCRIDVLYGFGTMYETWGAVVNS